jgi:hypothetical protein
MGNVNIVWRNLVLDKYLNSPGGQVGRYLKKQGTKVTTAARAQVGVKTGQLRSSIHMRHMRDSRGQYLKIGSSVKYAYMHHEGTKPHLILPKGPNTHLRFFSKGVIVFAPLVRHPGTKPNRYLSDNLKLIR